MENIDKLKLNITSKPKYKLQNGNLFVSEEGFHFLDYLDPVEELSNDVDDSKISESETNFIEKTLESNDEKFQSQTELVLNYINGNKPKLLDVGCGGGLFLSKIKKHCDVVIGIDLNDARIHYARTQHKLEIHKQPIESPFWIEEYKEFFDVVTLWDVIEHVNFPISTLKSSGEVLNKNGIIIINTPARNSFYHRFGELSYKLSKGKFPTFLNTLYSSELFGHKQIFSTDEMKLILEAIGFEILLIKKFHELSFPYSFYLKKILKINLLVKMALPLVNIFFILFPIKNKMLAIARKK